MFFTYTMFVLKHQSKKGNKFYKAFLRDKDCVDVYPMKSKDEFETNVC